MRLGRLILVVFGAAACDEAEPPRMDDLSSLVGDYERPSKDLFGDVETASLVVSQRGMTFAKEPKRDSVVFDRVECSSPTACKATTTLCSITLERRSDGDLSVNAEERCADMAGVWHTPDNAKRLAAELLGAAGASAPSSATGVSATAPPSAAPVATPSAPAASGSARALTPPAGGEPSAVDCLRGCNQRSMTCARRCKSGDLPCLSTCNADGFRCVLDCSR